jgi:hypothetical protein
VRKRVKVKASSLLLLVFTLALLPVGFTQAKKPLIGTMDLEFNTGWFVHGPQAFVPDWVGTITIDNDVYGISSKKFGRSTSLMMTTFQKYRMTNSMIGNTGYRVRDPVNSFYGDMT